MRPLALTKLSIFHLKNLGPIAIEYITALFSLSVTTCQILTSYRPISLLCPAAKVPESLILPTINKHLQPAPDQHGFRPDHFTTSALLQMTTGMAMGFNQRKPPDQTICVAVDLSAAFDTTITICCRRLTAHSSPGHSATAVMLSERKTIQYLLQRCKIDV